MRFVVLVRSNMTLEVLAGVYAEVAALFPDAYMHLGGDEVVIDCWNEDPKVVAWMQANGLDGKGVYQVGCAPPFSSLVSWI
jgi:N-acetyl-beta-hexosaminidase